MRCSQRLGVRILEFLGGYLIARAFFYGPAALNTFIRVLKVFAFTSIILGIADSISGRLIVHNALAAFVDTSGGPSAHFRGAIVRATSTFDHPILFGTFCCLAAAIFLYSESGALRRTLWVGLCFLGCLFSMSSAALLAFAIVLQAYTYDRLLQRYWWRWIAFCTVFAALACGLFAVSNNPISWVLLHLTLDPQTGYFRLMIWDAALLRISQSPIVGYAFNLFHDKILDSSVDSAWLVFALRFGIPMAAFLFLTNVLAVLPTVQNTSNKADAFYMGRMRSAFTMVLLMFMFIGLTVHFWNYLWIFWGLCIGIRVSLREWFTALASPAFQSRTTRIPVYASLRT